MTRRLLFASLGLSILLVGCGQNDKSNETPDSDYQRRLIERLIHFQLRGATVIADGRWHVLVPAIRTEPLQ